MPTQWTSEQVIALAPDASSVKSGRGLATISKWASLGCHESVIWGECQGSGKNPYQTQIDLSEPAFRCSCPSRKFPCKHGLGLFFILAEQSNQFTEIAPPDWVAQWIESRSQRAEKQAQKKEQAPDPVAQAKRAVARQEKVSAGVQELRLWLEDRIRQGLVAVQQESYQVWDTIAARMVDAQSPGLARRLRALAGIVHLGSGGHQQLLEQLGQLYLITEGYQRIESLPPTVQADLRTQIGWTMSQEEVLKEPSLADLWIVVGQRTEVEERLKVRRTWLFGIQSDRFALLLDFAHGNQPFSDHWIGGTCLEAELVFYPSAYPLRALIKTRQEATRLTKAPPGMSVLEAIAQFGTAIAQCPWLEQMPMILESVTLVKNNDLWMLQDAAGYNLPYQLEADNWTLLALSGGHPITLFGEWNGTKIRLLTCWAGDELYGL
ncbi:SWIM zinc finger family protein [Pseudanabaenaceae cyanobacterium LEGE 13415]|nr:SWIM zinc finger family protein [Pseudanabaenaceae cyanobacterium LEGE 13415]